MAEQNQTGQQGQNPFNRIPEPSSGSLSASTNNGSSDASLQRNSPGQAFQSASSLSAAAYPSLPHSTAMNLGPLLGFQNSLVAQNLFQQQMQQSQAQAQALMLQNLMKLTSSSSTTPTVLNQVPAAPAAAVQQAVPVSAPVAPQTQPQGNNTNAQMELLQNLMKFGSGAPGPPQQSQGLPANWLPGLQGATSTQASTTTLPQAGASLPAPTANNPQLNMLHNLISLSASTPQNPAPPNAPAGSAGPQPNAQAPTASAPGMMQQQGNGAQVNMLQNLLKLTAPGGLFVPPNAAAAQCVPGMNGQGAFAPMQMPSQQNPNQQLMMQNFLQQMAASNPNAPPGVNLPGLPMNAMKPLMIPQQGGVPAAMPMLPKKSCLPMPIFMDFDEETLTEYQCLLRKQIEVFEAGPEDVKASAQGRNNPILLGQVGIRCRHCTNLPLKCRPRGAVYYSRTIDGIYQVAQNMSKLHFCRTCSQIPPPVRMKLSTLQKVNRRAAGGKEYWAEGLRVLGVYEEGNVMRFRNSSSTTTTARVPSSIEI
jgi:hypothetical protein